MGGLGVNNQFYFNISEYYGPTPALHICNNCKFLSEVKNGTSFFGVEMHYKCSANTGAAAAKQGRGKMVGQCNEFRPAESGDKKSSKSSGGGFSLSAGKNIVGGLGQLTSMETADDFIGGVGKVGLGVGIGAAKLVGKGAVLAGKGIGKGIAAGVKAAKEDAERFSAKQAEEEEKVNAYLEQINSLQVIGDSNVIVQSLSELFTIIKWESELFMEDQDNVRDTAADKIKLGIIELTNQGDTTHAEYFQQCLEQTEWFQDKKREAERKEKADAMKAKAKEMLDKGVASTAAGAKKLFGSIKDKIKGEKEDQTSERVDAECQAPKNDV